ncbi:multiple organellar RNA editing factor 8, chloroplastic/mitochondrial-like [Argentina anserina]|uniref:multiple organellar RNA editing factor 8, chloroplastic/mitochondrial-like n=1 Tax=Argentina anserina TaxID=57926 RepID=UPI002176663C|nr:multiple organellar RNA editing factor 8, chloroplastic/mitochondrial-like [Potentilla anserina]
MATSFLSRSLPKTLALSSSFLSRSLSTAAAAAASSTLSSAHSRSLIHRLRPLAGAALSSAAKFSPHAVRCFSANPTNTSLRDPNPNWSNRPPKETILLDGCDFEHWLVVMEPPEEGVTRDDIIKEYIKTLALVVGSEEEARMKIYSVSTRCYFAFGALVSEELSYKLKELPKVRWVLPDSYLDVKNKDYGGEPFINGEAVPYDPKYHEEWIRNNSRANERNRRNDRPKNFDNSRNFNNRRENMQRREFQNSGPPPLPNQPGPNRPGMAGPPNNNMPPNMGAPNNNYGGGQAAYNQGPPSNYNQGPPNNYNQGPPNNYNQGPPNNYNQGPSNNYNQMPPSNNMRGPPPQNNMGGAPNNMGGAPPQPSWSDPAQYQNNGGGQNRY